MRVNLGMKGHLSLAESEATARKRLLLTSLASLFMGLLGVALVAALLPPDAGGDLMKPTPVASEAAPAALTSTPPTETVATPSADAGKHATDAEDTPTSVTPDAEADGPDEGNSEVVIDEVIDGDETENSAAEEDTESDTSEQWWADLHGVKCKIEFGDHKRLIMREGRLAKDMTTTYGPFVNEAIKSRVRESLDPIVTVHHFGIHPRNKRPSLAHVTLHQGGKKLSGILPLQISGDQIRLIPVRKIRRKR